MAKLVGYSASIRTARMEAVRTAIDAGGAAAQLRIYDGTRPSTGGAITTQILLAVLPLSYPCGTVSNGVLTFSAITADNSADADGNATWARIVTSESLFAVDLNAGAANADIVLNTAAIVAGGVVSVTSASITEGNA